MDTAGAIGAEMPKGRGGVGGGDEIKKHFSHCEFKRRQAEPTDADRQRKKKSKRDEGCTQSGNTVVGIVTCND